MRLILFSLLFSVFLFGQDTSESVESPQPLVSPEVIQEQLDSAEAQYNRALKMFSPWYTGPLITPGAGMMPPKYGNTQPYLFFIENYARYDANRKSVSLANNLFQFKAAANIITGFTDSFDFNITAFAQSSWQNSNQGGGFGDLAVTAGFLINKQSIYIPGVKFTVTQYFPTGKYKNLHSDLLNGTGSGSYSTLFGLGFSKVIFWATQHPMNLRLFLGYQLFTPVHVKGFNVYGGGNNCSGVVHPGNGFTSTFGYEISLTQKWVFALDVAYTFQNRTTFHGNAGTLAGGILSVVGSGYSDSLSLAPAIEYNFTPKVGLIFGGWFSVYGRNSLDFGAGIISLTYTFP